MKNVLFICNKNNCRSQMAQAFAIVHGKNKIRAFSAGYKPEAAVDKLAIEVMKEREYDLRIHETKSLQDVPLANYEFVIAMHENDVRSHIKASYFENWDIPETDKMDIDRLRNVRDKIEKKVIKLLAKIKSDIS